MSSDYIRRQAVEDAMTQSVCGDTWEVEKAIEAVRQLPAADVVPVVHGRWVDADFCGQYECSECGNNAVDLYDFCPDCGAKMDGKGEE